MHHLLLVYNAPATYLFEYLLWDSHLIGTSASIFHPTDVSNVNNWLVYKMRLVSLDSAFTVGML